MRISAVIGLATMAVGFVVLEWFNHAVMHPHRFMTHTEYTNTLVPGVPNARLLYAVAGTIIGVGFLWGLPFPPSEDAQSPSGTRRGIGIAISVLAMIALLALVIGTFPRGRSTRGSENSAHTRQNE